VQSIDRVANPRRFERSAAIVQSRRRCGRRTADEPDADFHFEMGRGLAERLATAADVERAPGEAVESFAGSGSSSTWPR
jgi:hypothetical protein